MLNRWVQVKEVRKLVSWRERCNVHTIVLQFFYWCIFKVSFNFRHPIDTICDSFNSLLRNINSRWQSFNERIKYVRLKNCRKTVQLTDTCLRIHKLVKVIFPWTDGIKTRKYFPGSFVRHASHPSVTTSFYTICKYTAGLNF